MTGNTMCANASDKTTRIEIRCSSDIKNRWHSISSEFSSSDGVILWLFENYDEFKKLRPVNRKRIIRGDGNGTYKPYCPKFNNEFRERVRAFWNYSCGNCGLPEVERKLSVHHVTYNKKACCEELKDDEDLLNEYKIKQEYKFLFVPLCRRCHGKTINNKSKWKKHFIELISRKYGGKTYFTEDEMSQFLNELKNRSKDVL